MNNKQKNRLVCIGDSLTQGFKSGAIFETNLSYPAIIAWEMGLADGEFRFPAFSGEGGLPINIEYLLRRLDQAFGKDVDWYEIPLASIHLRQWMDEVEDYWERGPGARLIGYAGPYHNLAVWGFEIQDAFQVTAGMCREMTEQPSDQWLQQGPENAMFRTALRVLNPNHSSAPPDVEATQISRATQLAKDGGIDNLIVFLGSNNVLSTVTKLEIQESTETDLAEKNPARRRATVYRAEHYDQLLTRLMDEVEKMNRPKGSVARVFWGTVPPVTVPPVTRGVGGRMESAEGLPPPYEGDDLQWYRRYFKFYTRPWVSDGNFNRREDPYLTGMQAMQIDHTIAQYNRLLKEKVAAHNQRCLQDNKEKDWFVVDLHWALERIAFRRYQEDPSVPPPPAWSPYEMPAPYASLGFNTRFLAARQGNRIDGGIFSLDGIHPTTAGYGLVAQEFINVMQQAKVDFYWGDQVTPRVGPVVVDFERLLRLDTLASRLPLTLDDLWKKMVDGDQLLDLFKRGIRSLF